MGFIDDELLDVKKLCEHVIPGTKLVSCVQTMVRAEIKETDFKKIIICIQFPLNYPAAPLLLELKSKTVSADLLDRLTHVCEQEVKKILGKPQVLYVINFLKKFISDNPLLCCYDEISAIKRNLGQEDYLKLRQKSSSVSLKVANKCYYLNCRITVPDNYYESAVIVEDVETNFTPAFCRHILAQAREIARKCVERPLKTKPKDAPFTPQPSLQKTVEFLIDCVKRLPQEYCQHCKKLCFPSDPKLLEKDENSPQHIERVYCGHLFHQECFFSFMKKPPFGNKKCDTCGQNIFHHKWSLNDKLAEARWAHEQARDRELQEVADFFK